jgi:hypothetical protein
MNFALNPGSSAIDAGNATVCAAAPVYNLDQRGVTRLVGVRCDIGAFDQGYYSRLIRRYHPKPRQVPQP